MTRVYLTRHGQTEWNLERRMQGQKNSDLTELGQQQASWLHNALNKEKLAHIYVSQSGRTRQTAALIRGDQEWPITPVAELMEIYLGSWEGMTFEEASETHPEAQHSFWKAPHKYVPVDDGETFEQLQQRAVSFIQKAVKEHEGQDILLVTHGIVLKTVMAYYKKIDIKELWSGEMMHPTALNLLLFKDDGSVEIAIEGDTSHYPEKIINQENWGK